MPAIEIRRPRIEDQEELIQFFSKVIKHTFSKEGLEELLDDIENEIEIKKQYLKSDLDTNGTNRYFLIAFDKNNAEVIGTIEYGPASELITTCTDGEIKEMYEIGTVFVHPDYQGRGVATLLLNVMFLTFLNRGIQEFCLDSGYANAQKIWKRKFGEPHYWLKDYWGDGADHMIWKKSMYDVSINFRW
ncbi:GNAT family N-acetyltransferase [Rossellomorea aquimaris]|uniref:GNAT family N-acetyltransferase n=1 Tax=Rossellomorea aquimaris TaxID=189382 RepID=UPI0011E93C16|nr:GNAT family N-acetyltransferase [Rossellomorea aquimaris]TYS87473.1 GNAT family N-acetyltransferase [Rossellomorea aquimaris]